nr:hypothetical protein [Pseudomonas sp. BGr12]MDL2422397.1 hypothetical protein [Pseudomonas sp. BGr12]
MSTTVSKFSKGKVITLLLLASLIFWYVTLPRVAVYYSRDGTERLHYIWNTQHRIDRGDMLPGQATADIGHLFPDEDFFMIFDWWIGKGTRSCIRISPEWGKTIDVYLDPAARIDATKTGPENIAHLKQCVGAPNPFRP